MAQGNIIKGFIFLLTIIVVVSLAITLTPPVEFPKGSMVEVSEGSSLYSVAQNLEEDNVIRSPFWFRVGAIVMGGERDMKAGQYYLERPESPFVLAWRILHGKYNVKSLKLTIPEGFTAKKISALFDERFPFFDNSHFERVAPEGYLFPDTYFVPVTASASSTIRMMKDNFIRKIFPLMPQVELSGRSLEDIIIMASIIESEANSQIDREIVSGILWRRIKIGMPLQVDVSFVYVNGKTTKDLTLDDLKIDSPYNTYLYRGLPPGPISNPGIESIEAAINPTSTPYTYFLTGHDGKMYYAKTFEEHIANKQKYMNR